MRERNHKVEIRKKKFLKGMGFKIKNVLPSSFLKGRSEENGNKKSLLRKVPEFH